MNRPGRREALATLAPFVRPRQEVRDVVATWLAAPPAAAGAAQAKTKARNTRKRTPPAK